MDKMEQYHTTPSIHVRLSFLVGDACFFSRLVQSSKAVWAYVRDGISLLTYRLVDTLDRAPAFTRSGGYHCEKN